MISTTERRIVKIKIPAFVDEYLNAYTSDDTEDCVELKEHFYNTYDRLTPQLQEGLKKFLLSYLEKNRIDDKKDLGGVFEALNLKLK